MAQIDNLEPSRRLMLEEFHPKVLHVACKENDAADALVSRQGMADNPDDELEWENPLLPLTYQDGEVRERDSNYYSL